MKYGIKDFFYFSFKLILSGFVFLSVSKADCISNKTPSLNQSAVHSHEHALNLNNLVSFVLFSSVEHDHEHDGSEGDDDEHTHAHSHNLAGISMLGDFLPVKFLEFTYFENLNEFTSYEKVLRCSAYKFQVFRPPIFIPS